MTPNSKIEGLREAVDLAYQKSRHHRKTGNTEAATALDEFGRILSKRAVEATKQNYREHGGVENYSDGRELCRLTNS